MDVVRMIYNINLSVINFRGFQRDGKETGGKELQARTKGLPGRMSHANHLTLLRFKQRPQRTAAAGAVSGLLQQFIDSSPYVLGALESGTYRLSEHPLRVGPSPFLLLLPLVNQGPSQVYILNFTLNILGPDKSLGEYI